MPLELIVLVFVVVAFVAIIARFMPRDAAGRRRLPRIVDESVGMYVLRRSLGRPTEASSDLAEVEVAATADVTEDEIAYRIGVPGAPEPTIPTRFVVSQAKPQAHPIPPVIPVAMRPVVGGRPQARRRGVALVPLRRRFAALGTLVAILLVGFSALSLPRAPEEAVLSATGTPGASPASSELAFVPSTSPTDAPPASEPPSPTASASSAPPTASPTAATPPPAIATQAVVPTPRATPRPTPRPTPRRTPPPTPAPTPPPTPAPTPTPTPAPPAASFDGTCDAGSLTVTFTGDDGVGSPSSTYDWSFGDASSDSGKVVSHTYEASDTYLVKLTVTSEGGASSAQQNITVPC